MGGEGFAFVTLVTDDNYSLGAITLGHSLRKTKTSAKLVIFVSGKLSHGTRETLQKIWDIVIDTISITSNDHENLALLSRPELGITLTKLRVWTLTHFEKCVFLDADTVVLDNIDDLFERSELSAARDTGWPDCFNSGVFVLEPSKETYNKLIDHMLENGSFDGGDQGLLNTFFGDRWRNDLQYHLPFTYNMVASISYTYAPAIRQYGKDAKVVHFLGATKPWHYSYDPNTSTVIGMPQGFNPNAHTMVASWWRMFLSAQNKYSSDRLHGNTPHNNTTNYKSKRTTETNLTQSFIKSLFPIHNTEDVTSNLEHIQTGSSIKLIISNTDEQKQLEMQDCSSTHTQHSSLSHQTNIQNAGGDEFVQSMAEMSLKPPVIGQADTATAAPATASELTAEQQEAEWKANWQSGNIDYNGRDSFQNILKELKRSISD